MSRQFWTTQERELLRSIYPHCHTTDVAAWLGKSIPAINNAAFGAGLRKSAEYMRADVALRAQRAMTDPRIIAKRIQPGQQPWNKGRKGWTAGGRSADTRFRKGNRPQTWHPVGTLILTEDRYCLVKVADTGNRRQRWRLLHQLVYEKAKGQVPTGHIVVFKRGMHTTDPALITADRLDCIDRAELARRNHPRCRDPELGRLIQLKGAIARQVNRIAREAAQQKAAA